MNKDALIALRDAVEAGSAEWDWGFAASPSRKALPENWHDAMNAYLGSLDAAKALQEAVLPGWQWLAASTDEHGSGKPTAIVLPDVTADHDGDTHQCSNDDHARAWLIAILKALIAEQKAPEA